MNLNLNGVLINNNLPISPVLSIKQIKDYFNEYVSSNYYKHTYTIRIIFNNGVELSPVIFNTSDYDAVTLELYAAFIKGGNIYIQLILPKPEPKQLHGNITMLPMLNLTDFGITDEETDEETEDVRVRRSNSKEEFINKYNRYIDANARNPPRRIISHFIGYTPARAEVFLEDDNEELNGIRVITSDSNDPLEPYYANVMKQIINIFEMENGDLIDIGGDRGDGMFYIDIEGNRGDFIRNMDENGSVLPPHALNMIMLNGRNYYSDVGHYPDRIAIPDNIRIEIIKDPDYEDGEYDDNDVYEHRVTQDDAIPTDQGDANYPDDILLINIDGNWIGMEGASVSKYN